MGEETSHCMNLEKIILKMGSSFYGFIILPKTLHWQPKLLQSLMGANKNAVFCETETTMVLVVWTQIISFKCKKTISFFKFVVPKRLSGF